jgi:integrase
MASFNVELNNKPFKNTKEYNLLLRITVNRKHARIKLNYAIQKKQFNPNPKEYKYVRASNPRHAVINAHIDEKIQEAKNVITDLEKKHSSVTANTIKAKMVKPTAISFISFGTQLANTLEENNHFGNSKKYKTVIAKLSDFRKEEDAQFDEITPAFLASFEAYLVKLGNAVNTIHGNFRTIRAIYYRAIEKGLVDQNKNPFFTFKLKLSNSSKDRLTIDEISKIENLELNSDNLIYHVRNAFLFSFYNAGIRISDLLMLKWENIQNGRVVYKMYKTNRIQSVKLLEKPNAILEKYKNGNGSYIFPFFSDKYDYTDSLFLHKQIESRTTLINKRLKTIATKAGITKTITTHTARHSFADIARQKTDNIYNLSKTLGHSSIKVTEAYLASFDQKAVDDTMDSMFK